MATEDRQQNDHLRKLMPEASISEGPHGPRPQNALKDTDLVKSL